MHPKSLPHQCNITSPMTTKARIILATAKQTSQSPSLTNHVFPKAFKIITSLMPPPQHRHLYHRQTVCIVITTNQLTVTNTYNTTKTPQTPCIKVFYVYSTSLHHATTSTSLPNNIQRQNTEQTFNHRDAFHISNTAHML